MPERSGNAANREGGLVLETGLEEPDAAWPRPAGCDRSSEAGGANHARPAIARPATRIPSLLIRVFSGLSPSESVVKGLYLRVRRFYDSPHSL
jgi:hypothetical protein